MASRNNEEAVVDHTAQKGSVEGQINPILPSTDPFVLAGLGAKDAVPKPYGKVSIESEHVKTKLEHVKTESAIMTEDNIPMPEAQLETLNSEHLQLDQAPLASGLSKVVHNPHLPQPQRKSVQDTSVQSAPECSASQLPEEFYGTDSAHTPSSLNPPLSPTSSRKSQSYNSSKPVSPEICGTVCEDHIPPLNPDSTRPASTPNSLNKPLSRRREGPDYPRYPDQSFKALEHQHHPPPYHPGQPHHLRTRSSQPSQKISFYPNEGVDVTEHPQLSSGSKTMGNTPVQSPGLFTPTLSKTRLLTSEPEEMRNPFGYASHLQEMKE